MNDRLRAPQDDGAILSVPAPSEAEVLVARNRQSLSNSSPRFLGIPWNDLRRQARHETTQAACEYLAEHGEPALNGSADSLVMAGHQPELFHPGVWIKNFALQKLARACRATPLALIVDNDTVKSTALRLPDKDGTSWLRAQLPFDFHGPDVPYEERTINDVSTFTSVPDRVAAIVSSWGFTPMLAEFWREVLGKHRRTSNLGECFAAARREFERRWGCHNLEVPVSRVCGTQAFAVFACNILCNIEEFHATYNNIVDHYRLANRIRSRNHPVPDLIRDGEWLEAPFWVWKTGEQRRGRLFASTTNGRTHLRAGAQTWHIDNAAPEQSWQRITESGFKIRPRALTTTLYARLLLADLFIHGIGGAKYDELTDELIRRYYGIDPPAFAIISGTLLLPFSRLMSHQNGCANLKHRLRDLWYNPQRHLPASASRETRTVADAREQWIVRACSTPQDRKERHMKLRSLSAALRPALAHVRNELASRAQECDSLSASQAVLNRRDYAFCLFPEDKLRRWIETL